jgi:hypothetical protein
LPVVFALNIGYSETIRGYTGRAEIKASRGVKKCSRYYKTM